MNREQTKHWQRTQATGKAAVKRANNKLKESIKGYNMDHLFRRNVKHSYGTFATARSHYKHNGIDVFGR